ncbi:MAG: class I SAM-dependent methyltransferase [Bacteroidetes bacterium]|nr:class I SAM-dependent methyltransferase [Bacteroidota bacterium]
MAEQHEDQNQVYYRDYYRFPTRSRWMEKVWSEAFGAEYPAGLDYYGYVTRHDLRVFAERLQLTEGSEILDIGCGKGGPGLWLAKELNLKLTGIDIISEAVDHANQFKESFDLQYPANFMVGEFYKIPLPDQSMDAVISFDSLWAAPNKVQALFEVKRVMKPGAKFLFTYWDLLSIEAIPYFEMTGLKFIHREDTPDWKAYQNRVYEGILQHESELVAEMGAAANMLLYEAKASPPYLDLSVRRIYELGLD